MVGFLNISLQHLISHLYLIIIIKPKNDHIRYIILKRFFFFQDINILKYYLLFPSIYFNQIFWFHALILNILITLFAAYVSNVNNLINFTDNVDFIQLKFISIKTNFQFFLAFFIELSKHLSGWPVSMAAMAQI